MSMSSRLGSKEKDVSDTEVKTSKSTDDTEQSLRRSLSPQHRVGSKDHRDRKRSRSPHHRRRSHSRERRRSRSRERDRRRRRRSSRSSSTERHEKDRERSKMEMRQQLARNYEEQIEKLKSNQYGPPPQAGHKYPNQVHVEPSKLVEQIEKRKFLFKKDKPAEATTSNTTLWKNTAFTDDSDGKMSAKFKRLMGMKDNETAVSGSGSGSGTGSGNSGTASTNTDNDSVKKLDEYFANLEKQYEVARATTHTQRGLGLGFSSGRVFPVHPKPGNVVIFCGFLNLTSDAHEADRSSS
ncbi:unnamed protein product [Allacma fusca]|uniref:Small acidic protein-like domain-containing protein n=1 Tax=Allacma fusca TaxID=39272 RepID=A0A8J2LNW7_9HEXA|nr:unnamed protein product [Allacma fusca]